ncbi:hypothetical protein Tco_0201674 [Tanacetum coccineum]
MVIRTSRRTLVVPKLKPTILRLLGARWWVVDEEGAGDMEVEMTRSGDDESGGGRLWSPELFAGERMGRRKVIERERMKMRWG